VREQEIRWVSDHRAEYQGKWVVVEGNELIGSGDDAKALYEEARARGIEVPFLVQVECENEWEFGRW
jgi:Family of unknown function (DUF5678)